MIKEKCPSCGKEMEITHFTVNLDHVGRINVNWHCADHGNVSTDHWPKRKARRFVGDLMGHEVFKGIPEEVVVVPFSPVGMGYLVQGMAYDVLLSLYIDAMEQFREAKKEAAWLERCFDAKDECYTWLQAKVDAYEHQILLLPRCRQCSSSAGLDDGDDCPAFVQHGWEGSKVAKVGGASPGQCGYFTPAFQTPVKQTTGDRCPRCGNRKSSTDPRESLCVCLPASRPYPKCQDSPDGSCNACHHQPECKSLSPPVPEETYRKFLQLKKEDIKKQIDAIKDNKTRDEPRLDR